MNTTYHLKSTHLALALLAFLMNSTMRITAACAESQITKTPNYLRWDSQPPVNLDGPPSSDISYNARPTNSDIPPLVPDMPLDCARKNLHAALTALPHLKKNDPRNEPFPLERSVRQMLLSLVIQPKATSAAGSEAVDVKDVIKFIKPKTLDILTYLDQHLSGGLTLGTLIGSATAGWHSKNPESSLRDIEQKTLVSLADALSLKYGHHPSISKPSGTLQVDGQPVTSTPVWWSTQCADIAFKGRTLGIDSLFYSGNREEQNFMRFLTYLACRGYFYVHGDKYAYNATVTPHNSSSPGQSMADSYPEQLLKEFGENDRLYDQNKSPITAFTIKK